MSKFESTSFAGPQAQILKFPEHYVALAVMVSDAGIAANADGKKIVPAGTIVGGASAAVLADEAQLVVEKNTQGTTGPEAEGILAYDVDVTYGAASGAMIIHGFVDTGKLPAVPSVDAVAALKQITFVE